MNLTRIISIKERIAVSAEFKPDERDFILDAINIAVEAAAVASGPTEELMRCAEGLARGAYLTPDERSLVYQFIRKAVRS